MYVSIIYKGYAVVAIKSTREDLLDKNGPSEIQIRQTDCSVGEEEAKCRCESVASVLHHSFCEPPAFFLSFLPFSAASTESNVSVSSDIKNQLWLAF